MMSAYRPQHGERTVFDHGAWATWDAKLKRFEIYDPNGRHRGHRDTEEAAERFAESLGTYDD
jgi:hypothetical protein